MTDPRARLLLLLMVGTLAVLLDRPALLAALCAGCAAPFLLLRIPGRWRRAGIGVALAITWSTALSQGLFYAEEPRVALVRLGPVVLWWEGVVHGLVQSLRLVSIAFAGVAVAVSTPPDRLFAGLVGLRVPYALAFLAVTALRFVPLTAEELLVVRRARARRGRPLARRTPWAWLRTEMALLRPVVARSLRRAHTLAESLDVRGFDPAVARAQRRPLGMTRVDIALLGVAGAVVVAVAAAEVVYGLYVAEVWYEPALRGLYGFVRRWL